MAVQMSPEVETALGPQMADEARHALDASGGTCMYCRQPITTDESSNVVIGQGQGVTIGAVWFCHTACGDSRIIPLPDEAALAIAQPDDGHTMAMTALLRPNGPALIAETAQRIVTNIDHPGAEPTSVMISAMLKSGFQLVSHPDADVAPVAEWIGVLLPHGKARGLLILDPEGEQFFRGTVEVPAGWQRAALQQRSCTLLIGEVGLPDLAERSDAARFDALVTAAQAGRLVGGRISFGRPSDYGLN
jgi:hypothetical protein